MEHYKLVMPEHLNHHGFLYGGQLLKWIDEAAYITANLELPGNQLVTVALDNVAFKHRIENGKIVCFRIELVRVGNTSVEYRVTALDDVIEKGDERILFETNITFVNVDESGAKRPLRITEAE